MDYTVSKSSKTIKCCIKGCDVRRRRNDSDETIYFYKFPSPTFEWRNYRRQQWIKAIIKNTDVDKDWQPKNHHMICSNHFAGGKKSEHPLHPGYNPTIFPGGSIEKGKKAAARFKRHMQRMQNKATASVPSASSISTLSKTKIMSLPQPTQFIKVEENYFEDNQDEYYSNAKIEFSDFECQVNFLDGCRSKNLNPDYITCNLRIENNLNCAETQVNTQNIKKSKDKILTTKACTTTLFYKGKATKAEIPSTPSCTIVLQSVQFTGISSIQSNNELMDMCGVTFNVFSLFLKSIPVMNHISISNSNRLLIFLMKLKQGIKFSVLSTLFNLQQTLIIQIFVETLHSFTQFLTDNVHWPSKETIKTVLPKAFIDTHPKCKAIIDCIEIQVEIPENKQEMVKFYSRYKDCHSFKLFLACAPNGFITYKSKCYGSQKSNETVANDCGFLDLINSGDIILSDKEFPSVKTALVNKKATLITITSIENNDLTVYTHIKHCLNRLKLFKILSNIPAELLSQIDDIVHLCCTLVNLQLPKIQPE